MTDKRCDECKKDGLINSLCVRCREKREVSDLLSGECTALPRVDFGAAVSQEEKQALTDNALIRHGRYYPDDKGML